MKKMITICFGLILLFLSVSLSAQKKTAEDPYRLKPVGEEAYEAIVQFYQYDKQLPLDLRIVETVKTGEYIREKIVFRGTGSSRAVGYLTLPVSGQPPYPCVLQMHGLNVSKDDFWEFEYHHAELVTQELLKSSIALLGLDMPYHGERSHENDFEPAVAMLFEKGLGYRFRDMIVQTVIEYRRAMDYLATREEIDSERIGALGYSIGGVAAFIATGVDDRIQTSVACAAPTMKPRPFLPEEKYVSGIAAHTFAGAVDGRPFLMLNGEKDDFNCTVGEANQLFKLISSDRKDIIFYESGHCLPEEHAQEAVNWFLEYLLPQNM